MSGKIFSQEGAYPMADQEKDREACTAESCKQDLMNGLLAILAEEEEKETEHK